jgi:predicted esterase
MSFSLRTALPLAAFTLAHALGAPIAHAEAIYSEPRIKPTDDAPAWCARETEELPGDVCYLAGGAGAHRTLVVFLHGAIAKGTTWQHNHQRGLLGLAKGNHVDVIFPKAPLSDKGYVWQGPRVLDEEDRLVEGWMRAKQLLEKRAGRPYEEVFVMGFSSGAYFASTLAMRGRLDVDGYAVLAGGSSAPPPPKPVRHWAPVFVGVCANDTTSANDSRAFAAALATANIPRAVSEQPIGHGMSHVHFAYAISYLRAAKRPSSS